MSLWIKLADNFQIFKCLLLPLLDGSTCELLGAWWTIDVQQPTAQTTSLELHYKQM